MKGIIFPLVLAVLIGCGSSDTSTKTNDAQKTTVKKEEGALTEFQLKNGIGPITEELKLGPIDKALAKTGEKAFETKCFSCHRMDERYVGPALRDVTKRRTNEFVVNMILNPDEMTKKHPETKKLLAEYMTPMTFQNVSKDEAMALLEYLRLAATEKK